MYDFSDIQFWTLVIALVLWTLPWKGIALWRAARLRDKWWFVAILLVNTIGLLEIVYIYYFSKNKEDRR